MIVIDNKLKVQFGDNNGFSILSHFSMQNIADFVNSVEAFIILAVPQLQRSRD